ncbi:MAG: PrgI family protein [Candidatus Lloydbacteria bacterium]|nr:PrgI family protein [Candidatus Lloydbacteria bacterium]
MRYEVPQFIEVEDKVFGPLTIRQFLYLTGGAGLSYLLWVSFPTFFAVLFIIPVVALALALAFYQINNRSFAQAIENGVQYFFSNKLYLWKKEPKPIVREAAEAPSKNEPSYIPKLSESKLKDIAWGLDVHESLYAGTDTEKQKKEKVFKA